MADELGTAVLTLVIDQEAFKQSLQQAKTQLRDELGTVSPGRTTPGRGSRRRDTPQDADAARRFNLRGTVRGLEPIRRAGRLNLSTIWGKFLEDLDDTYEVIQQARAAKAKTTSVRGSVIANNWGLFLEDLDDTYRVIQSAKQQTAKTQSVKGSKVANSWGTFLEDLDDTYQTIQQAKGASAKTARVRGNVIANSWSVFLGQLQETANVIDQARRAGQQAEGKRIGALNASPVRGGVAFPGSPIALEKAAAAERQLARERDKTTKATQKAAEQERRKAGERRRDIIANVAIGAGFPLLFGQGVGAAAGGALGGGLGALAGGTAGFAGSIVGTALGAAFDTALQKAQALAQGLDDPIKNFDALREAALLSSKGVEKNAEALIAAGREEEAAALIRNDLLKTFGTPEGAAEFTAATDELNRAWTQATVSLTAFVSGPLGRFLKGISLFLGGGAAGAAAADVARAREIAASSPEKQRQLEALVRRRGGTLNAEGNIAGAPSVPIFREYLKLNGELTQEQKNQKEVEDALAVGRDRAVLLNRINLDLIEASARGNELQAIALQKQAVEQERIAKLNALGAKTPQATKDLINEEARRKVLELDERATKIQQERDAVLFQELQKRQQIERSAANTLELLSAENTQYRDTLRTVQQINTSIQEARQREQQLGFQIDQARQGGREEDALRLVAEQRTAAAETRLKLFEGALALKEAGEKLRKDLTAAVLDFTKIRSDPQGLNRFLSGEQRARRAEQDFQLLLPQFRQAQGRFQELTGQRAPEFRGTATGVNEAIRGFIESTNREFEARQNLIGVQRSLTEVNSELININTQLRDATLQLANKNWVVNVDPASAAGPATSINAVNGLS